MVRGTLKDKREFISPDEVLYQTDWGFDVYKRYLGQVKREMKRPWPGEKKETKPSWGIFKAGGKWIWADRAREESGNAIQFVQRYFGLDFNDAVTKICNDFGLDRYRQVSGGIIIPASVREEEEKVYAKGKFDIMRFEKRHHLFWNKAGISEDFCRKHETWAISAAFMKGKNLKVRPDEAAFAYYCPELDKVKFYFPDREKESRFKSNLPGTHLWNLSNIVTQSTGKCDTLLIQKSNKDRLVAMLFTPHVANSESETAKLFDREYYPEVMESIEGVAHRIVLGYGSDQDGRTKAAKVCWRNRWEQCSPSRILLPEINDFYSLAVHHGLEAVEALLKHKKII